MMLPIPSPTPGGNARGVSILSSRRVKTRSGGNLFLTGKLYVVFLRWASWWLSDKESACQCKRCGINLWVGKIPWRKDMATQSSILAGKFHGQRLLVG